MDHHHLITGETLTGDLILQYPTISRLFTENHIDFYRNGTLSLKEALKDKPVNIEDFLIRVNALVELESLSDQQKKQVNSPPSTS